MKRVNVLAFHDISNTSKAHSTITPEIFLSSLSHINEAGLSALTLQDIASGRIREGQRPICLTFDDGWESHAGFVLPEFLKRGMKGTFFVITEKVGSPGYVTWQQVDELSKAGMEIGSHTRSHPEDMTRLLDEEILEEFLSSRLELENRLGRPPESVSIPHGFWNRRVLAGAKKAGYVNVCISRRGLNPFPLRAPILRNAFHGKITTADLSKMISPAIQTRLNLKAVSLMTSLIKTVLPARWYEPFRHAVLSVLFREIPD